MRILRNCATKRLITGALLALLHAGPLAHSASAADFAQDDLLMGFHATDGTGASQTYVFNLGSSILYRNGTAAPNVGTINTDMVETFGSDWFTRTNLYWGVAGAWSAAPSGVQNGDPSRTNYVTRTATGPGTSQPWVLPVSALGTGASDIKSFQTSFSNPATIPTPTSGGRGVVYPVSSPNSWDFYNRPRPGGPSFTVYTGGIEGTFGTGALLAYLDLYRIINRTAGADPSGTPGTGTLEGTFSINAGGEITFSAASAPAPPIITSPASAVGTQGQPFSYQITASGNPTSFDAAPLPAGLSINTSTGLISGTLTDLGTTQVTLSATNASGTGTQILSLTITAPAPPAITSPASAMGVQGQPFTYQITASGNPTSFGATPLPAGLSIDTSTGLISGTPADVGTTQVTLSATNAFGTGTQTLSLTITALAPPIVTSPASASGRQGQPFSYQITASGNPTSFGAAPLPAGLSVNTSTGLISGTPADVGTTQVTLSATNAAGTGTQTLSLTITAPAPPIITSPASAMGVQGQAFTYQITASGNPTSFGAAPLPAGLSVNTSTGLISGTPEQTGTTQVTLSAANADGTATQTLSLTIDPPPAVPALLLNISTRARVGAGGNVLIGGFIIRGLSPKKVLVRALGPSLSGRGVGNALEDPVLELHNAENVIATNDNWEDSERAAILASGQAPTDDRESAIIRTLLPGAYTAIESGFQGATGVGLIEVYDLDSASLTTLTNISTRGLVQTGDNVMIGGFIVGGSSGVTSVVIRAIGPSLSGAGISDFLPDPILQLHDSNGTMIAFNDNWRDLQEADLQATGLAPQSDLEAAILRSFPPGSYTAIVRGIGDAATGVGLMEIFRLSP